MTENELSNSLTINSREVANMMDIDHSNLLKKLEGNSQRKGYIEMVKIAISNEILAKYKCTPLKITDYFIESSYIDEQGKSRKCYEITRLGCDFLAHKSTGQKGVNFTIAYMNKFHMMEEALKQNMNIAHSNDDLAYIVAQTVKTTLEALNISTPKVDEKHLEYSDFQKRFLEYFTGKDWKPIWNDIKEKYNEMYKQDIINMSARCNCKNPFYAMRDTEVEHGLEILEMLKNNNYPNSSYVK